MSTVARTTSKRSSRRNWSATYGSFTFNELTGVWGYKLDNTKPVVQALKATDVVHDTLVVKSLDGSATQTIDVTINGTNDAPVIVDHFDPLKQAIAVVKSSSPLCWLKG